MRRSAGRVAATDVGHVVVFRDPHTYAAHPNRGGIWAFPDGEVAVAHLVHDVCYDPEGMRAPDGTRLWHPHDYWTVPGAGVMIHRSFDGGATWSDRDRGWIWSNDRSLDDILEWLQPVDRQERARVDLGQPDSIVHFCWAHYLKWPFGGARQHRLSYFRTQGRPPSFCLRSPDRGRTWESRPTVIGAPPSGDGFCANDLGSVRFDNGTLGIVGTTHFRQGAGPGAACFYISDDDGLSWRFVSTIAEPEDLGSVDDYRSIARNDADVLTPPIGHTAWGAPPGSVVPVDYIYTGVHRLPDERLMCCMHLRPQNWPCIAMSEDGGVTWSPPRFIVEVGPSVRDPEPDGPVLPRAIDDKEGPRYRSPYALVLRDGRVLVLYTKRSYEPGAPRGIMGVVSEDLGDSWSEPFVVRGDAYCWDCGYPVAVELADGRILTVYYLSTAEGDEPVHEQACVRYVAGTLFRLPYLPKAD